MLPSGFLSILDFGCRSFVDLQSQLVAVLPGAVICVALLAGMAVLGRLVMRGTHFQPVHVLSGWAVLAASMTLAAILFPGQLHYVALVIFGLMGAALPQALRAKYFQTPFWLVTIFPGIIVLGAINAAGVAKWDDFSHWVLNALYLVKNNGIPHHSLPVPYAVWPGYPYALPFLTYLSSEIAGGFLMQAGAMINFLILLVFAAMLADLHKPSPVVVRKIGLLGLALLVVTLMNPSFNASFTMTNQGDTSTMVAVGALGVMLWQLIEALKSKDQKSIQALTLSVALVNTLLVLIKQSNLALVGLFILAFLVLAGKNAVLKEASRRLPVLLIPSLVFRFIWQRYVSLEIDGNGFALQPIHAWRFDLLGSMFQAMGQEMIKKIGCFGLMLFVIVSGGLNLFRPVTPLRNFMVLAATVCSGYLAFLIVCYIGTSFSEVEIRRAASFYRYSTHTGLLGVTALWIAAPLVWQWLKEEKHIVGASKFLPFGSVASVAVLGVLPLSLIIQAHWLVAQPDSKMCSFREQGQKIATELPAHSRVAVVEPESDGLLSYVINFELALDDARTDRDSRVLKHAQGCNGELFAEYVAPINNPSTINAFFMPKAEHKVCAVAGMSNSEAPLLLSRDR